MTAQQKKLLERIQKRVSKGLVAQPEPEDVFGIDIYLARDSDGIFIDAGESKYLADREAIVTLFRSIADAVEKAP